ncbi:hypothetical protein BB559_001741 [Furculomyces boomerangus]|uniref:Uncharacterized protein n=1 Tax=Furculomyces boomerangus TaxID=61424 RepID=A0A2T9Z0W1_9FUNG|nr:hypothetical protein BB559_001741 [Furculomyces boomerangus]
MVLTYLLLLEHSNSISSNSKTRFGEEFGDRETSIRTSLLECLIILVGKPTAGKSSILPHAVRLFSAGLVSTNNGISSVCKRGLTVAESIVHPIYPLLSIPTQDDTVVQILRNKEQNIYESNEAIEANVSDYSLNNDFDDETHIEKQEMDITEPENTGRAISDGNGATSNYIGEEREIKKSRMEIEVVRKPAFEKAGDEYTKDEPKTSDINTNSFGKMKSEIIQYSRDENTEIKVNKVTSTEISVEIGSIEASTEFEVDEDIPTINFDASDSD